jgi:hypothetical protein
VTTNYGDPSTGLVGNWAQSGAINESLTESHSANSSGWGWLTNNTNTGGVPVYAQWTRPTAYSVGTVLYDVIKFVGYTNTTAPVNYTLQFANGSPGLTTTNWNATPIVASTSTNSAPSSAIPINLLTLPSVTSATSFRMEFSQTQARTDSPSSVAIVDEALILPDRYQRVAFTATNAHPTFAAANAADMDSGSQFLDQFATGTQTLDMNFGTAKQIDALVFYTYNGFPSDFVVRDGDTNQVVMTVSGATTTGDVIPIKLSSYITTSDLKIEFVRRGDNNAGMAEVIPLALLPEPSTLGVLAIPSIAMLRRRRRRDAIA